MDDRTKLTKPIDKHFRADNNAPALRLVWTIISHLFLNCDTVHERTCATTLKIKNNVGGVGGLTSLTGLLRRKQQLMNQTATGFESDILLVDRLAHVSRGIPTARVTKPPPLFCQGS